MHGKGLWIMATCSYIQRKVSSLDYAINLAEWLPAGDTLSVVTYNVPSGITKVSDSFTATVITMWLSLSAATVGQSYTITATYMTAMGRIDEHNIIITVI